MEPAFEPPHIAAAGRILGQARLCDACLGRCFGKVGTGTTNDARGRVLRAAVGGGPAAPPADCAVCEGLFGELDHLAALVVGALGDLEFDTFLIGSRNDPDIAAREQALWTQATPEEAEPLSSAVNREVGKRVAALLGKEADPAKPDVAAIVDTRFDQVELQITPVFVYARYRKFVRDIPQTRWPCRDCRGRGCTKCGLTGKQYPTSVQELIQAEAIRAFQARDADFHGMGREDIDARCLGTGRPFVLELKEPRRRRVDLVALQEGINAHARPHVEIEGLRPSKRPEVAAIKAGDTTKEYAAVVAFGAPVDQANVFKAVEGLRGAAVAQRTPSRVQHRRAALTRHRAVLDIAVEQTAPQEAILRIRGEAGLYIKELVSGDDGRTRPSLAELLGTPCRVTALDVVAVAELPPEGAPTATR